MNNYRIKINKLLLIVIYIFFTSILIYSEEYGFMNELYGMCYVDVINVYGDKNISEDSIPEHVLNFSQVFQIHSSIDKVDSNDDSSIYYIERTNGKAAFRGWIKVDDYEIETATWLPGITSDSLMFNPLAKDFNKLWSILDTGYPWISYDDDLNKIPGFYSSKTFMGARIRLNYTDEVLFIAEYTQVLPDMTYEILIRDPSARYMQGRLVQIKI